MVNKIKRMFSMLIVALLLAVSVCTAFAASSTVNGKEVKVGDEIEYNIYLGDVPYNVAGVQMYIYYDPSCLEVVKDSAKCDVLSGETINDKGTDGRIIITCSEGVFGFDFTKTHQLVGFKFKVKGEGNSKITYNIQEMYDIYEYGPKDYLKRYTLTSSMSINNKEVIKNEAPIINDKAASSDKGTFVMQQSGKGADNNKPTESTYTPYTVATKIVDGQVVYVTNGENRENQSTTTAEGNEMSTTAIFTIIGIVVIVIAIIIVIIAKNKSISVSDENNNDDNS